MKTQIVDRPALKIVIQLREFRRPKEGDSKRAELTASKTITLHGIALSKAYPEVLKLAESWEKTL